LRVSRRILTAVVRIGQQFDAGRGVHQRLSQVGLTERNLDAVFLTHLHSDHVVGFPDLWLTGWLTTRRDRPLKLFGPPGAARMMDHLKQAFEVDIRVRIDEANTPPAGAEVQATDIQEGVIYDRNGVKVTAIKVDHRSIPAFGYRIDYAGHSVVLSGDTQVSANLIELAQCTDLLIHEVFDATEELVKQNPTLAKVVLLHTTARQAGEVFQRVRPKLAVYSHIVLLGFSVADLVTRTRVSYSGPLVVGEDLMRFVVGGSITISRP